MRKLGRMKSTFRIDMHTDLYYEDGKFLPVPRDENGHYTVDFLRKNGVDVIKSEIKQQIHHDSDGRPYIQKMRVDTITDNTPPPIVCMFYNSRQGNCGIMPIPS